MKVKLCGNQLVGMLGIICSLNFDTLTMLHSNFDDFLMSLAQRKKRSLSYDSEDYYGDNRRYTMPRFPVGGLMRCLRRSMGKRGLAMACCNTPCSMQDLRGFC